MFASILLALASALPAFAAPARRDEVLLGGCDLSGVALVIPDGVAIPAPYGAPKYVTVGGGTQNYTCGSDGKYTSTGAVAELFDLSCIVFTDAFDTVQDVVLNIVHEALDPTLGRRNDIYADVNIPLLADHYFVVNPITETGISPKFDFSPSVGDFVTGKVDNTTAAPTGPQDVNWLKLSNIEGGLSDLVYRTDTREGQPPAQCNCETDGDIQVVYAAKYWFF